MVQGEASLTQAAWGMGREVATTPRPPCSGLNLLSSQTHSPGQPDPAPPCCFQTSSPSAQNFPFFPLASQSLPRPSSPSQAPPPPGNLPTPGPPGHFWPPFLPHWPRERSMISMRQLLHGGQPGSTTKQRGLGQVNLSALISYPGKSASLWGGCEVE